MALSPEKFQKYVDTIKNSSKLIKLKEKTVFKIDLLSISSSKEEFEAVVPEINNKLRENTESHEHRIAAARVRSYYGAILAHFAIIEQEDEEMTEGDSPHFHSENSEEGQQQKLEQISNQIESLLTQNKENIQRDLEKARKNVEKAEEAWKQEQERAKQKGETPDPVVASMLKLEIARKEGLESAARANGLQIAEGNQLNQAILTGYQSKNPKHSPDQTKKSPTSDAPKTKSMEKHQACCSVM